MDSGVATRPIPDFNEYRNRLTRFVYASGAPMAPIFAAAQRAPKRVAFAEGEDERVLRAAQAGIDEGIVHPVLIGRTDIIESRIKRLGLRLTLGRDCEGVNILDDPRYKDYSQDYYMLARRMGVNRPQALEEMRTRPTLIGAMLVRRGEVDAMLCGTLGNFADHLKYVRNVIGMREGRAGARRDADGHAAGPAAIHLRHAREPRSERRELAEMTLLAVEQVRRFGQEPCVAMLSHSSFGSSDAPSARKMRDALALILRRMPDLAVEGEMHADSALSKTIRDREFPDSRLKADANLLIMPNVDAANITYNALRVTAGEGITVGGILLGAAKPVHILTPSATVRRILNMTAVAVAEAGALETAAPDSPRGARPIEALAALDRQRPNAA